MEIVASATLRNDYVGLSDRARKTMKPIYITRNGKGDGVFMNIEAFERREEILNLREKVLKAEEARINGAKTISVKEAREMLRGRARDEG